MALSTFADGHLWGARYGTGRPWALALHGWGRDHHDFDPVLEGFDAIALDLPGFGLSPEPPGAWSTLEYAKHVAPVLGELDAGSAVVLGHSFGARVSVQLARITDGGVISGLVLAGAPLAPFPESAPSRRPPIAYRLGRVMHRAGLLGEERMEKLRRKFGSDDYRKASPVMRGVLVKAVQETAGAEYIPLLDRWARGGGRLELLWGQDDAEASLAGARAALARAPEVTANVTVVPGAAHLLNGELVTQLRDALMRCKA